MASFVQMRTTINIDDEVIHMVRELSEARRISLGDAASFLIMRGFAISLPHKQKNGFALFNVDSSTPKFDLEDVNRALEDEDEDLSGFFAGRGTDGSSA